MGNNENTDVGAFLREYLGLEAEVEEISAELVDKMGKIKGEESGFGARSGERDRYH